MDPCGHLNIRRKLIQQLSPQHRDQGIGVAEVGREAVEGIAQGTVAVESGEEGQVRLLLAEHIGGVADRVMVEGPSQASQNHLLPSQFLP